VNLIPLPTPFIYSSLTLNSHPRSVVYNSELVRDGSGSGQESVGVWVPSRDDVPVGNKEGAVGLRDAESSGRSERLIVDPGFE